MIDELLLQQLKILTTEEQNILDGKLYLDKNIYFKNENMVVDFQKLVKKGKNIQIRPNTRFIHFPKHRHNYIEVVYMCLGKTKHIIDGNEIILNEGELLFLNQNAVQEVFPAGENDIAVNFIILDGFFETSLQMLNGDKNILRDFLVGCLFNHKKYESYLHFKVAQVLPVQNLVENLIWTIKNDQPNKQNINQVTMSLLFMQLLNFTQMLSNQSNNFEQNLTIQILKYIEENYKDGSLNELAVLLDTDIYWLGRMIKKLLNKTFKELIINKKLDQSAFLLINSKMIICDIGTAVGYNNISYFHRIFREKYGISPNEYRQVKLGERYENI